MQLNDKNKGKSLSSLNLNGSTFIKFSSYRLHVYRIAGVYTIDLTVRHREQLLMGDGQDPVKKVSDASESWLTRNRATPMIRKPRPSSTNLKHQLLSKLLSA